MQNRSPKPQHKILMIVLNFKLFLQLTFLSEKSVSFFFSIFQGLGQHLPLPDDQTLLSLKPHQIYGE